MEWKGLELSNSGLAYDESFKKWDFFYFYLWMILSTLGGSWRADTRFAPLVAASRPAMTALSINERVLACGGYSCTHYH